MKIRSYHIIKTLGILLFALYIGTANINTAQASIIFDNEFLIENPGGNTWIIDSKDDATANSTTHLQFQFGNSLTPANNGTLSWDIGNQQFTFDRSISLGGNEIKNVVLDNQAGTPACSSANKGQIYYNTSDNNTYVCNGLTSNWEDVTALNVTQTKVVTVGSTNADYTTIADAATYLNALSGGIILLSAENHTVTTAIDLSNVTLIGKDASKTTITVSGAGQLDSFDTTYKSLKLQINSITDTKAIDTQAGASSLYFEWVDIGVLDTGDALIGSNAGTAPTVTVKLVNCNQTAGSGTILKTQGTSNLNGASTIFVSSSSGNNLLQIQDWPVTIAGAGNVLTSGIISTIPSNTIYVYPGMNLQGAINSLTSGGYITLLPGTHTISSPLLITNDNIAITGYGDSSIISASGFTGITGTTAAIQIGTANGTTPNNKVNLKDFRLEIGANDIHGIRITGGQDNQITNVTIKKTAGASADKAGIQLSNSSAATLSRPIIKNNRIFGTSAAIYFLDGIQVNLDTSGGFSGTKGTQNALIDGNSVDYTGEDAYSLVGMENSSIFNNHGAHMGASATSYGMYISNGGNLNINGNTLTSSLRATEIGIGIEPDNQGSLTETIDSIITANTLDGMASGGSGFTTGFLIGNAANTGVHRNSVQNNSVLGAAVGTTVAIDIRGNADDNSFANNSFSGGANAWDTGFLLESSTQERNIIQNNRYTNVTVFFTESGTNTRREVTHHESTANPGITDDQSKGYKVGMIWVNTSTQISYILVNDTVGAAVWNRLDLASTTGDKYLWVDIGGGVRTSATIGTVASTNSPVIQFDAANASNSRWSFSVPDDWQAGTNINVDVFWSPSNTNTGNLVLSLAYAGILAGNTVGTTPGDFATLSNTVAAPGTTLQLSSTTFALSSAKLAANQMVDINLGRATGGSDTFTGNANIHMVRIRYTGKKLQ